MCIQANYTRLHRDVVEQGVAGLEGPRPSAEMVRGWHRKSLQGVRLAEPAVAGHFRGEGPPGSKLFTCRNWVNTRTGWRYPGEDPDAVADRVEDMFAELERRLDGLDRRAAEGEAMDTMYADILGTCAWVHGEWVRIHPFVDHNGSTARLMTIAVGLRYGVPLPLPGKPRTAMAGEGMVANYELAAEQQMLGTDSTMVVVLHQLASGDGGDSP